MNTQIGEEMYLLDNNALSHLTRAQRASDFFFDRCRVPTEVIHEAAGYPDSESFGRAEYPTTPRVLEIVREIMTTLPPEDTSLVNLYSNLGAADPMLLACALHATEEAHAGLFGSRWVIVTNDKAVRGVALSLGVEAVSREQFQRATTGAWSDWMQTLPPEMGERP